MSRSRLALLLTLTLVLPALLVIAALAVQRTRATWTDGRALQVATSYAQSRDVIWRPAESVPGSVNSNVDEYEPRASPDGTTLVFVRRRPGANADLVSSRWTPDGWTAPEPAAALNSDADELGPEFAADGWTLWFASNREGGFGDFDLWYATIEGDGSFGPPTNAGATVNTRYAEYGAARTPDGTTLFFASDRPRADELPTAPDDSAWSATLRERTHRHDHDLYVLGLSTSGPATAERVSTLSTPYDEGSPAISPAGDFLYFASDRPDGRGGFDLYRARLFGSDPQSPERLDDTVNSSANELDPALASDGFRLYFSSDRASAQASGMFAAGDEPADYGLWWTTSREVFRSEPTFSSALASVWAALWPWLLLIAAMIAIALLLAWLIHALIRNVDWRKRYARLSLLVKCLVVSLLLHVLIASLLTMWTVGLKVGELLNAGGTRVILASAINDDGFSAAATQILASPIALEETPFLATSVEVSMIAPVLATIEPSQPTEPTVPPRSSEPEPLAAITATADAMPVPMPREITHLDVATPTTPEPIAREEREPESTTPSIELNSTPIAAPAAVAAPIAPALPVRATAPRESALNDLRANATLPTIALTSASPLLPLALPKAPAPTLPSSVDRAAPLAPTAATEMLRPSIVIELPSAAPSTADAPLPRAAGSADGLSNPTLAHSPLPMSSPPGSTSAFSPRLPAAPEEAPAPVETFEQRDPEARGELIDQLGGSAETEKAVGRALEWFRRTQSSDGRWSSRNLESEVDADGAMTGLALLAFLGAGHTHVDDGPYRATVDKALRWIMTRESASGDLRGNGATADSMFGQTIATVALCEAYAMTRDPALAAVARRAADFVIATSRNPRTARDKDTAVLGWLIMTVESARRAGFDPPSDVFASAGAWLDSVARGNAKGEYAYRAGDAASVGMTAEAMFVQQILGHDRAEARMAQSAQLVLSSPPRWNRDAPTHSWYYATLALFQQQGDAWKTWNESLAPLLMEHQRSDDAFAGSWDPQDKWSHMCGRAYQTAVCTLSLEVYYRYRLKEQASGQPAPAASSAPRRLPR